MKFFNLELKLPVCALNIAALAVSAFILSGCLSSESVQSIKSGQSSLALGTVVPNPTYTGNPNTPVSLTPQIASLTLNQETALITSGGVPPYQYTVVSGGGQISAGNGSITGFYRAARAPGQATILAQDTTGKTATATVSITVANPRLPNDPQYSAQPGLALINAPTAWPIQNDCSKVKVAVLDTGVDLNHPELKNNVWINTGEVAGNGLDDDKNGVADDIQGWNFSVAGAGNNNTNDDNFHGTHVSGTIGAISDNGIGVSGLCWKASIMPVKALNSQGAGTVSQMIAGIGYATASGAKIINASLGLPINSGISQTELNALQNAITQARNAGVIFVAAAGNQANNNDVTPAYPATFPVNNIVSVGAITTGNTLASFSNFGATSVHIAAPGVSILSTFPSTVTSGMQTSNTQRQQAGLAPYATSYESISGTSMAAPHVTGVLALLWATEPTYSYQQVITQLLNTSDRLNNLQTQISGGRKLNAARALYPGLP